MPKKQKLTKGSSALSLNFGLRKASYCAGMVRTGGTLVGKDTAGLGGNAAEKAGRGVFGPRDLGRG